MGSNGLSVSIHLNAANSNAVGTEVLHYNNQGLAAKVSAKIASVLGIMDRGPKDGKSIGYISSTKAEAILIEICFIDNPSDMKKLMDNFDAVAAGIVEAITGKSIESGGGNLVANEDGRRKIKTGGLGFNAIKEVSEVLCSRGIKSSIIFEGAGTAPYLLTEKMKNPEMDNFTVWLNGNNWYYEYIK
ncbi:N-acetylmuramoyl-L-alanine amidase [Bacillus pseudomycoides]|uniref:N-acetylmuramoyl-L-alanine amidase n=1 Tax=Bacillus pseudomycoides TaxID=64104 RepID=A0AA91ZTM2_9BACI|nr:N-acetylmuramoyl-L-alanine amidase [Bacillus sp. AFS098217]PEB50821.1 N-acetylmuramoyl-L-alanine amidase [Bacillus sp. AFS098217]PED82976.1 N-acetylmuramoyl-L-alanine amidase [Bacillus pseudomycoides]PEU20114.1 N-acetylmuramoyl-L-alanine amidase [Bacillus sp. AFS014408]PFW62513.1 N-acetylmuramoyl-L-alanine amidase [Bacillus sp. AFS075034]